MKRERGFTVLELLVVIAIIGILAVVVSIGIADAREKAKVANAVSQIRSMHNATALYLADTGVLPPNCSLNCTASTDPYITPPVGVPGWRGPYYPGGVWNLRHPWGGHFSVEHSDVTGDGIVDTYFFLDEDAPGTHYSDNTGFIPFSALKKIDTLVDDGNLATGNARGNGLGYDGALGEIVILFKP